MIRSASLILAGVLLLGVGVGASHEPWKGKSATAIGVVRWVGGTSFTVDTDKGDVTFDVSPNTIIQARGASTKTRAKKDAGEGGVTMADVVHVGDQVVVRYSPSGDGFLASEIDVKHQRPVSQSIR